MSEQGSAPPTEARPRRAAPGAFGPLARDRGRVCCSPRSALYALARETSMFAVQAIEVEGASPALAADVRAELSSLRRPSLVAVNGDAVAQRVDGLPAVRSTTVDRAFPHTLRRFGSSRRCPSRCCVAAPSSWLVSARGRVIAAIPRGAYRTLPRIWLPVAYRPREGRVPRGRARCARGPLARRLRRQRLPEPHLVRARARRPDHARDCAAASRSSSAPRSTCA